MVDISKTFNRPLKSEILNGARQLLNKKWGPIRKLSLIAHAFARFTPLLVLSSAKSVSKNNNDLKAFAFKKHPISRRLIFPYKSLISSNPFPNLAPMTFDLNELSVPQRQYYLQHLIAPRPICFASTIDKQGNINLSPFSFFNLFSSNPPIVIFSPSRRVRDNTTKHTLENVKEVPEVVINMVTYEMVQQVSLASCEFGKEVNEFIKAGFTEEPATIVKPPMVKESLAKLECRVIEIKALGTEAGAGNLIICEVIKMHIDDSLLDENKKIDQRNIHHVARLGADWYCRVDESNLFEVAKPNTKLGMGIDSLPAAIRESHILSANNLGQLANVAQLPAIDPSFEDPHLKHIIQYYSINPDDMDKEIHSYAKKLLDEGQVEKAWQVLLSDTDNFSE